MSQIKKIGNRMEITPKPEKLGNVVRAERADEVVTLGQLNDYGVSGVAYKKYVAIMSQSGTDDPTALVMENTLGATITWVYDGVGSYYGNLSSAVLTPNKTWFISGNTADLNTITTINSTSQVQINTNGDIATPSNTMMTNVAIEIRVYN